MVAGQSVQEFLPLGILDLHEQMINVEKIIGVLKNNEKQQENNNKDTQTGRQEETHSHKDTYSQLTYEH